MSIASSGNLIDALREAGLLSRTQLGQLAGLPEGRCGDVRPLAKLLVQRGLLSVFQANQVLLGKAHELAFGPYHILDRLGQGGLSAVYKARHSVHEWLVALKVIQPEVIACAEGRRQFLLEMEAMARLDHPNIVQFCDADQVGETVYYAMEYVAGTDLGKYVRLTGWLPVGEACDFIRQTALGLQHAHERNLVHRDIKPVNLYLTHEPVAGAVPRASWPGQAPAKPGPAPRPIIKILDWGLASLRNPRGVPAGDAVESLARGVVGTADYLSPEQARDAHTVDIRGDLYSLGCTFYYLLTGQPPFPEGALMYKILQHQNAEPRPVGEFRDDVPEEVLLILRRLMAKKPEKRFQTPAALGLALLPFARSGGAGSAGQACLTPRAARSTSVSDQTPLPPGLGGVPGTSPTRTSKVRHQADAP